jgi:hypothetical protein
MQTWAGRSKGDQQTEHPVCTHYLLVLLPDLTAAAHLEATLLLFLPLLVLVLVVVEGKGNMDNTRARPTISQLEFTGCGTAY